MKKGYSVEYSSFCEKDNCMIVDNYNNENMVYILAIPIEIIKDVTDERTIGVWKIKKLN